MWNINGVRRSYITRAQRYFVFTYRPNCSDLYPKIPTAILYDAEGNVQQWGQAAETTKLQDKIPKGWQYCNRFKLRLDENFTSSKQLSGLPTGKEFVDVIADYLREMHKYVLTLALVDPKYTRDQIQYTLTIPASWTPDAKRYMRSAAIHAGLVGIEDPSERLILVSEPEAALVSCLKTHPNIEMSKTVMICDAGGNLFPFYLLFATKNFVVIGIVNYLYTHRRRYRRYVHISNQEEDGWRAGFERNLPWQRKVCWIHDA